MIFNRLKPGKRIVALTLFSILALIFPGTAFADIWGGVFTDRTDAVFDAYYDASVASYGYTDHYDQAREWWSYVSSKVYIGKTTSTSNYPDKYYAGVTEDPDLLGLTINYKKGFLGRIVTAGFNDDWLYSTVAIYDNNIQSVGLDRDQIMTLTSHELGHTVKLAHTTDSGVVSVMFAYFFDCYPTPTGYDEGELRTKWGL